MQKQNAGHIKSVKWDMKFARLYSSETKKELTERRSKNENDE